MKFTHISVQPLFSVVFLSNVTLSGLSEEMKKKDHVNINVTELSLGLVLKFKPRYSIHKRILLDVFTKQKGCIG